MDSAILHCRLSRVARNGQTKHRLERKKPYIFMWERETRGVCSWLQSATSQPGAAKSYTLDL